MSEHPSIAFIEPAFQLASANPIAAVKTLARALRLQSRGAQQTAVRMLVAALVEHDPAVLVGIIADLNRLAPKG
jgi:hypothetical protein